MWISTTYDTTKLTVELRDIVESGANIWDFDYPSYYTGDEKKAFEQKFIDHYYFRQIGQETVGRWLHFFRARIREIMPYYIQMYKSVEIMDKIPDPFGNVDIKETFEQTSTEQATGQENGSVSGSGTGTHTETTDNQHKFSNTPQGSIETLENYMSEASVDNNRNNETSTNESETTSTSNTETNKAGTVSHTYTKKGNQGVNTYAHDMIEFRQSFINVDMMIIDSCNDLFLGIY